MYILEGIVLGLIYALVACGYSLIFSVLRMINFAHGASYAFGAIIAYMFLGLNFNPWLALLLSMTLTGFLSISINKFTIEPLKKKDSPMIITLITTIGISYVITNVLIVFFGSGRISFPTFYDFGLNLQIGNYVLTSSKIVLISVSSLLMLIMSLIVSKTHLGLSIRATQQNPKAAQLMGINTNNVVTITFFLSGVTASIAGTLVAGYYQVCYPTMGNIMGSKTLATALLGGLGSMHGGLIAGIIIGILESIVAGLLGATFRDAVSFIILIIILIFRPTGLFGMKGISKV